MNKLVLMILTVFFLSAARLGFTVESGNQEIKAPLSKYYEERQALHKKYKAEMEALYKKHQAVMQVMHQRHQEINQKE